MQRLNQRPPSSAISTEICLAQFWAGVPTFLSEISLNFTMVDERITETAILQAKLHISKDQHFPLETF